MGVSNKHRLLLLFFVGAVTSGCGEYLTSAWNAESENVSASGISQEKAEQIAVRWIGGRVIPGRTEHKARPTTNLLQTSSRPTDFVYVVQVEGTAESPIRADFSAASEIGIDCDYRQTYKSATVTVRESDGLVLSHEKVPIDGKPASPCKPLTITFQPSNRVNLGDTVIVQFTNLPDGKYDAYLKHINDDNRAFGKMVKLNTFSPINHTASLSVIVKPAVDGSGRPFPLQSGDRLHVEIVADGWDIGSELFVQ